ESDRVAFAREGRLEALPILGNALEHVDDMLGCGGHLYRRLNRALRLRPQIFGTAIPELRHVEDRVEHGRRVAGALLPAMADGSLDIVGPAGSKVVTGVAAHDPARRQARIEPEHAAEIDLLAGNGISLYLGHHRGDRIE